MQCSQSSSSQPERKVSLYSPVAVWLLRLLTGGLFVMSGFVKGVDPWGSVIKISEYLTVWGLDIPHPVITGAAFALGTFEFVWGSLLVAGCYRRVSVWMLTLMMAFMLPLTLYIAIYSPVDDCGCFGDFIILSNTATFLKNVAISACLIYLICYNTRVAGLYIPYVQWLIGGIVTFYIFCVELYGYNIQPLIDFRQYAPGTSLLDTHDDSETVYGYIYERDGKRETFEIDNLPDSTWTFVDRILLEGSELTSDGFTILSDGDDITADVIDYDSPIFIVTIPEFDSNIDLSYTYVINELSDFINSKGGYLMALIGGNDDDIEHWKDISMASYMVHQADPKMLKELARGNAALVFVDQGVVKWKRTLSSVSYSLVTDTPKSELLKALDPENSYMLKLLTTAYVIILLVILALDHSGKTIALHIRKSRLAKSKN